jgi:peptide chain release factor 1
MKPFHGFMWQCLWFLQLKQFATMSSVGVQEADLIGLLQDEDAAVRAEALHELSVVTRQQSTLTQDLLLGLLPEDEDSKCGVVMEVRAGTGGQEASLFAEELFKMYHAFASTLPLLISDHP